MASHANGILLHLSSLPGGYGIGDVGPAATSFLERLSAADQKFWQVLPLHPTGAARSPYDARSSFAGDPLLISPESLVADGLLSPDRRPRPLTDGTDSVDFRRARAVKESVLRDCWRCFRREAPRVQRRAFDAFRDGDSQRSWLEDWSLYAALRQKLETPWWQWPADLRDRRAGALRSARQDLAAEIDVERFAQFLFHQQWRRLRARARELGVALIGDLPIYVAHDSAEVWSRPELFDLDQEGCPRAVAGVPPDAFTSDGQRWGNPVYRWPRHRAESYRWWVERVALSLDRFDRLRIDHFRGLVAYWRVDADQPTARSGRWKRGPGWSLFRALQAELGSSLPLIAEDLGHITPAVTRLRRRLELPGTRVVQFGFDNERSPHRPDRVSEDNVLYTGTHDNDTTRGWLESLDDDRRQRLDRFLGTSTRSVDPAETTWQLIEATLSSAAHLTIVPMQDVLTLGSPARMNTPGSTDGNWRWRMLPGAFGDDLVDRLRNATDTSGRSATSGVTEAVAAPGEAS